MNGLRSSNGAISSMLLLVASIACSSGNLNGPDSGTATTGQGGTAGINTGQAGAGGVGGTTGMAGADAGGTGGAAPAGTTGQTGGIGGGAAGADGGRGGTPGPGAHGGAGFVTPSCLANLLATCPLAGSCTHNAGDTVEKWCFASGETVSRAKVACSLPGTGVTEVRRGDGTLCYTIQGTSERCESTTYVWKDPSGTIVARGGFSRNPAGASSSVTCETSSESCTADSTQFPPRSGETCVPSELVSPAAAKGCTEGTCP